MNNKIEVVHTTKADRYNELTGKEIECKLKIVSDHPISEVAQIIHGNLLNSFSKFQVATSLSNVITSKTIARHYAYQNPQGKIKKIFTITQRDRDGLLQIKRKGPKTVYYQNILSKPESIETVTWAEWTKDAELAVINNEVKSLDSSVKPKHIFLVTGEAHRKKLKIRVINKNNNRTYTIGIDETTAPNGRTLKQIEIEYIGIEPAIHTSEPRYPTRYNNLTELEIATEIKSLETFITEKCNKVNINLIPTQQTKFKWLRKMHSEKEGLCTFRTSRIVA